MFTQDTTTQTIKFSYPINDIFKKASRASAFSARGMRDKEGNSLFDDYSLTDDEMDIFEQGLDSILPDIYNKIIKLTSGVENAYDLDEELSEVIFIIQDNNAYNKNTLILVDKSFEECLIEGSLMAWYKNCANADLLELYLKTFDSALEKLYSRMFQLKLKNSVSMLTDL